VVVLNVEKEAQGTPATLQIGNLALEEAANPIAPFLAAANPQPEAIAATTGDVASKVVSQLAADMEGQGGEAPVSEFGNIVPMKLSSKDAPDGGKPILTVSHLLLSPPSPKCACPVER
jgi:hypothetical protein